MPITVTVKEFAEQMSKLMNRDDFNAVIESIVNAPPLSSVQKKILREEKKNKVSGYRKKEAP